MTRSICCYYGLKSDGKTCNWCGESGPTTNTEHPHPLIGELNALLCDWDSPSKMGTYDLNDNISKVFTFMKKKGML